MSEIQELIEELDLCLELIGYEREALERMREDGKYCFYGGRGGGKGEGGYLLDQRE